MLQIEQKYFRIALLGATLYLILLEVGRVFLAHQFPGPQESKQVAMIFTLLSIPTIALLCITGSAAFGPRDRRGPGGYLRETVLTLGCLAFLSLAHGGLLLRIGTAVPPVLPTTLYFILACVPRIGLYLLFARLLSPATSSAAASLLCFATCSSFLWAGSWIESASETERPKRIEWVLASNPVLVAAGGLLDDDLLRRHWTYEHSPIGSFYRFEYPDKTATTLQYVFFGVLFWLMGLGLSFLIPILCHRGKRSPENLL